jgi:non-ribosomal peptide synthetase component F
MEKEFENIVGLFANFVILRSDLSKISNFYQLVTLIKNNILEAHDNSEFPFEEVLAANNIDISSLFMFVMHEEKIRRNDL